MADDLLRLRNIEMEMQYQQVMGPRQVPLPLRSVGDSNPLAPASDVRLAQMQMKNFSIRGTEGSRERLFPEYKVPKHPQKFFRFGRVFTILWAEPSGEVGSDNASNITFADYDQKVFSKVRRLVVIRESHSSAACLAIMTYGNQGCSKRGVKKSDHGIIYTGSVSPEPLACELPASGESPMRPHSIQVLPDNPTLKLHASSRIDYGKIYTVEHNVKVKSFGIVSPNCTNSLRSNFQDVWFEQPADLGRRIQQQRRSLISNHHRVDGSSVDRRIRSSRTDAKGNPKETDGPTEEEQEYDSDDGFDNNVGNGEDNDSDTA